MMNRLLALGLILFATSCNAATITDYIIVRLSEQWVKSGDVYCCPIITRLLGEGWQPFGSPSSTGRGVHFFQAMVKYDKID